MLCRLVGQWWRGLLVSAFSADTFALTAPMSGDSYVYEPPSLDWSVRTSKLHTAIRKNPDRANGQSSACCASTCAAMSATSWWNASTS